MTADAAGRYRLSPMPSLIGKWHLRIEPMDERWRLQQSVQFPLGEALHLHPLEE